MYIKSLITFDFGNLKERAVARQGKSFGPEERFGPLKDAGVRQLISN